MNLVSLESTAEEKAAARSSLIPMPEVADISEAGVTVTAFPERGRKSVTLNVAATDDRRCIAHPRLATI